MVRFRSTLIAVAFVAAGIAPVAAQASIVSAVGCVTIVAFGSSSTEGVGASTKARSYPAQLDADLRIAMPKGQRATVVNRGIGGEDAAAMMKRLDKDVIARKPNLVIWQTGSNDPMTKNPLPRFERETRDGILAMRAAGIEVILMEPQWAPHLDKVSGSTRYRDAVRRIGAEMGVVVIRRDELMRDWARTGVMTRKQMMSDDGLHMSDRGYLALAHCVAREVMRSEAVRHLAPTEMATKTPATKTLTCLGDPCPLEGPGEAGRPLVARVFYCL